MKRALNCNKNIGSIVSLEGKTKELYKIDKEEKVFNWMKKKKKKAEVASQLFHVLFKVLLLFSLVLLLLLFAVYNAFTFCHWMEFMHSIYRKEHSVSTFPCALALTLSFHYKMQTNLLVQSNKDIFCVNCRAFHVDCQCFGFFSVTSLGCCKIISAIVKLA